MGKLHKWSEGERRKLAALVAAGNNREAVTAIVKTDWGIDTTFEAVKHVIVDTRKTHPHWFVADAATIEATLPSLPPRLTGAWNLDEGDGWAIYGDDHGACIDLTLFAAMASASKRLGVSNLLSGGDKWNADAFSRHSKTAPAMPFKVEREVQEYVSKLAQSVYGQEKILSGNHDNWIPRATDGKLDHESAKRMFLAWLGNPQNTDWSEYAYCHINSPTLGLIRVSHPRNYSRSRAATAEKLAVKHGCHVITFHEHRRGFKQVETQAGMKLAVSCGCMASPDKFAYAQLEDCTTPPMEQGFVILKDGRLFLYDQSGENPFVLGVGEEV